ncbi:hypothetical protein Cgig2_001709 [Carnegiea gigantea]|uniref:Uncharacterized protein n=1 Tax=Carnegiea gigantea TaxID=171969 RepID=A0A9Q1GIS0_9CARY|nr:hypothetical protein Cgig2_001709 [Carnegiea gigantea]
MGGLAEETCPVGMAVIRWRLARAVTSWRLVCQEKHPFIVTLQGRQGSAGRRWAAVSLEEMRLLGCTPGYTVLGGLASLTGHVQEMNRMLGSLLDKEKSTPSPHREGVDSAMEQQVILGARIYDQWYCATTPSTYSGARHANKPRHCATTSNTYGGTNLRDMRHRLVPVVIQT